MSSTRPKTPTAAASDASLTRRPVPSPPAPPSAFANRPRTPNAGNLLRRRRSTFAEQPGPRLWGDLLPDEGKSRKAGRRVREALLAVVALVGIALFLVREETVNDKALMRGLMAKWAFGGLRIRSNDAVNKDGGSGEADDDEALVRVQVLPVQPDMAQCVRTGGCSPDGREHIGMWDEKVWKMFERRQDERTKKGKQELDEEKFDGDDLAEYADAEPDFYFMFFGHYCTAHFHQCLVPGSLWRSGLSSVRDYSLGSVERQPPPHRVVVPMSHDFGSCFFFEGGSLQAVLERANGNDQVEFTARSIVLSPYGDKDTPCYNETTDIVVPPYSPATRSTLLAHFGDVARIPPTSSRRYLFSLSATMAYDHRAPGIRAQLTHYPWNKLDDLFLPQRQGAKTLHSDKYAEMLASSQFCLIPPGVVGWSPRLSDSVFAGCIPVIIAHDTVLPFERQMDYSKFTIQLDSREVMKDPSIVETTLRGMTDEDKAELQREGLAMRNAFVYTDDFESSDSPYAYILRELAMKKEEMIAAGTWDVATDGESYN
eukprot:CAMPEP_0198366936 /NCGR_PEP_ID=MMETSP1450-20131203/154931_1 /TAXON_ID=753684 ORGANISM="Madagascaria erythrocladiodes, Strain CCMP3234" /NCGR_SAMPLE_ID=MMETSP1450 /ASSEMBLY_ACC=CAM_ASM_001115 /LENGTH=540 /DNA_ID=CAMNT_0044074405 /DNA_START=95 /DNA_END=1717 /DNA_ORIENTATION=+